MWWISNFGNKKQVTMRFVLIQDPTLGKKEYSEILWHYGFLLDTSYLSIRPILAPKNGEINKRVWDFLPGSSRTYKSVYISITADESELLQFSTEFLKGLEITGLPPHGNPVTSHDFEGRCNSNALEKSKFNERIINWHKTLSEKYLRTLWV